MDGFTPLALDETQLLMTETSRPPTEPGEWVAVRAGDSALVIWFPAEPA